jgi:hypothetical protein
VFLVSYRPPRACVDRGAHTHPTSSFRDPWAMRQIGRLSNPHQHDPPSSRRQECSLPRPPRLWRAVAGHTARNSRARRTRVSSPDLAGLRLTGHSAMLVQRCPRRRGYVFQLLSETCLTEYPVYLRKNQARGRCNDAVTRTTPVRAAFGGARITHRSPWLSTYC